VFIINGLKCNFKSIILQRKEVTAEIVERTYFSDLQKAQPNLTFERPVSPLATSSLCYSSSSKVPIEETCPGRRR